MRTLRSVLLAGTMAVGFAGAAEAAPITGVINFFGATSFNATTMTIPMAMVSPLPAPTGSFAGLFTPAATVVWTSPIQFSPAVTPGLIWTVNEGINIATFTATGGSGSVTSGGFLNISMTGIFTLTGYDPTPGILTVSSQSVTSVTGPFSFSATAEAIPVPEPASLALLGAGLLGLGFAARRRQAA